MDACDSAKALEDLTIKLALKNRKAEAELPEVGACHYCEAIIEKGNFCDSDCRDDYEKMVSL